MTDNFQPSEDIFDEVEGHAFKMKTEAEDTPVEGHGFKMHIEEEDTDDTEGHSLRSGH